jgi:hypothetical protein
MVTQKKVFVGWAGKSDQEIGFDNAEFKELILPYIYKHKMKRETWVSEDWPPRKVRVTVEYLD